MIGNYDIGILWIGVFGIPPVVGDGDTRKVHGTNINIASRIIIASKEERRSRIKVITVT